MQKGKQSAVARRALDRRISGLRAIGDVTVPHRGWIAAIRGGLGMSQRDLARRLSVSGPAVAKLEAAERSGGITLATFRQVPEALDCTVVYVLVPRTSLEDTVQREARSAARRIVQPVATTMALEAQSVGPEREAEVLESIAEEPHHPVPCLAVTDGSILDEPLGATPLDPDDRQSLIPTWVATRADLDQAELIAIARAGHGRKPKHDGLARRVSCAASLSSLCTVGCSLTSRVGLVSFADARR